MGQYFHPVNLDRREYVNSHDYGDGAKLMEHSWLLNTFVNSVLSLLKPGGSWYKTRMVWAGDYMDDGLFLEDIGAEGHGPTTLYACCEERETVTTPIISKIKPVLADGPATRYLVNHKLLQYVDFQNLPEEDEGWVIHPLPLLTCSGNGRGGGDYTGKNEYAGSWAGHVISAEYLRPSGYTEIKPSFTERKAVEPTEMVQKAFTTERLENIRRLRKARRLFKIAPLFAYILMKEEYPDYEYPAFLDDLRRRTKPKPRAKKNTLSRYGRYQRMIQYINQYQETGDYTLLMKAQALRNHITKSYRIVVRLNKVEYTYKVSALIPIERIEFLMWQIEKCSQPEEVENIVNSVSEYGI